MRKATIRDICNDTGLSMGTVSKYLNGGVLKESNRKKIDAAIRKFDYRVDEYARGLITNRTKTVGVLITKMNNLFYTRIISHIEAFLYKKGYSTIIKESSGDLQKELDSIDWLISRRVDALVIIPVGRTKEDYRLLDNVGIPVVFLDSYIEGVNCESIVVDNENITYKASDYMIKNGHRKISVIADMNSPYTANARLAGVKRAFRENAISFIRSTRASTRAIKSRARSCRKQIRPRSLHPTISVRSARCTFSTSLTSRCRTKFLSWGSTIL